jgi:hypothetical protein
MIGSVGSITTTGCWLVAGLVAAGAARTSQQGSRGPHDGACPVLLTRRGNSHAMRQAGTDDLVVPVAYTKKK